MSAHSRLTNMKLRQRRLALAGELSGRSSDFEVDFSTVPIPVLEESPKPRPYKRGFNRHSPEIVALYVRQQGRCYWCDRSVEKRFHIDHRIALARGGADEIANLVVACAKCNMIKGAKSPEEFRRYLEENRPGYLTNG